MNTTTAKLTDKAMVLACVDHSPYAPRVADWAAWAAQRLNTGLELLHVLDRDQPLQSDQDHSGALGVNAQENLLKKIVDEQELRSRQARETGRRLLNDLRQRVIDQGLTLVDMRQRHGELIESLLERQNQTVLVVMGRRGHSSGTTSRELGSNLEHVVRAMNRPILTVTDEFKIPKRLLIAYDGGSASRKGVEMVATSPAFAGMACSVVMVKSSATKDAPKQLAGAQARLAQAGLDVDTHLLIGDFETLMSKSIQTLGADLLVMGAYTRSPIRSLFTGSHTTDLLRAARIPTLLLR